MDAELNGQTFLVTGASSGIGRSTAQALAARGARLVLWGRDEARLVATRDSLAGAGHMLEIGSLDDPDLAHDAVKRRAGETGELQGIFHAAGTELVRPIRMTKRTHIDELFGPAVYGALGLARAGASKGVLADGASLVFMSSVAATRGTAGMAAYSAAKAAVEGMVRSLACEMASRRIRVNALAAGAVQTEMHERLTGTLGDAAVAEYEARHPLGFGETEDIAAAALFLLGPASKWITGTTFVVDGGYSAR